MPLFPLPAKLVRLVVLSLFVLAAVAFFLLQSETSSSWTPAFLSTAPAAPPRNLTSRLDDLLHRPVKSAEVWRTTNALACPKDTYEREPSFMHQGHFRESWDRVGEVEVRKMRSELVRYMEEIESNGQLEQDLKEEPKRGILMTGGNGETLKLIVVLLKLLRNVYNCQLPIEIYHYPDELSSPTDRALLEGFGVDLREVDAAHSHSKGYQIKPYAFIDTSFTQFLYMDSDSLPVRNPEDLFDSFEFNDPSSGGSVWWADSFKLHPENAIWRLLGQPCDDRLWSLETGQVLFDKRGNGGMNLAALHVTHSMMISGGAWNEVSWGDKDLFLYGLMALDLPFAMAPMQHSGIAREHFIPSFDPCEHTMLHYGLTPPSEIANQDFHPSPHFAHLTRLKNVVANFNSNEPLFVYLRRLRKDRLDEPTAVRMKRGHGSSCPFNTIWGANLETEFDDGFGDGQGIIQENVKTAFGGVLAEFESQWRSVGGWI